MECLPTVPITSAGCHDSLKAQPVKEEFLISEAIMILNDDQAAYENLSGCPGEQSERCFKISEENDTTSASISFPASSHGFLQKSPKSPLSTKSANYNVEDAENTDPAETTCTTPFSAKPFPSRLGTKRLRGKGGSKANMCRNGLHCRVHDVLAPTATILDNCMNALNIPHFATIQLMNYGDEIFELETKRHLRIGEESHFERNSETPVSNLPRQIF